MHIQGGGGFSPGACQDCSFPVQYCNGIFSVEPKEHSSGQNGGCYFSDAKYDNTGLVWVGSLLDGIGGKIGGQGGANKGVWFRDSGGDGGIAGSGGVVRVSTTAKVFAYNGNECTLSEDEDGYYKKPLEIFGQNGVHRAVYKTNQWWGTEEAPERSIKYFEAIWGKGNLNEDAYNAKRGLTSDTARNVLVKEEYKTEPIKYKLEEKTQGIGSRSWLYRTR